MKKSVVYGIRAKGSDDCVELVEKVSDFLSLQLPDATEKLEVDQYIFNRTLKEEEIKEILADES